MDLQVSGGRCKRTNEYALARIADLKPDIVILAQAANHTDTDWEALAAQLRRLGAKDVVVVGPAPQWRQRLAEIVTSRYWGRNYDRVGDLLVVERAADDQLLKARYGNAASLKYVSLIDALCGADTCLAVIPGSTPPELMTFDTGHFTPNASRYVARVALDKVNAVTADSETLVIAADTTIELDGDIIAKPADLADARAMLRRLSGRTHAVHTGVALRLGDRCLTETVTSRVMFVVLTDEIIDWYVATGEPLDKAGAYAIQGAGAVLVDNVEGSVSNIIGLPLHTIVELAAQLGVTLLA